MTKFGGYTRDELHLDGHVVWVPGVTDGRDHCIIAGVDDTDGRHVSQARPPNCRTYVDVPWRPHDELPSCPVCRGWDRARQRARVTPVFTDLLRRLLRG